MARSLRALAPPGGHARDQVSALLGVSDIFGPHLAGDADLVQSLAQALTRQRERGALAALTIGSD